MQITLNFEEMPIEDWASTVSDLIRVEFHKQIASAIRMEVNDALLAHEKAIRTRVLDYLKTIDLDTIVREDMKRRELKV